jgi:homoserine kinase
MKATVRVPATSANLGPGFDVFGLAINWYNRFTVEESEQFEIIIRGRWGELTDSEDNLFYHSFRSLFDKSGERIPPVQITLDLRVPPGRGFGSSATAVVGGLMAANAFLGHRYSKEELLPFAIELERGQHPDNVAPAILGGLVVITSGDSQIAYVKLPFPSKIKGVFFIPDFAMDTIVGRTLVPSEYPKQDVVFNIGRVALFVAALQTKQYHLLRTAMEDRVHQPPRTKIFPCMPELIKAALDAGALGAALSGAGPSIIALADGCFEKIANAMAKKAEEKGIAGETAVLSITNKGASVLNDGR